VRTIRWCATGAFVGALLPVAITVAGKACQQRACPATLVLDLLAMFLVLMPASLPSGALAFFERLCPVPPTSIASIVAKASLVWALVGAALAALVLASVAAYARPGKRSLRRLARFDEAAARRRRPTTPLDPGPLDP
jgi:hypothetical protein